jgi:hypothetical protein
MGLCLGPKDYLKTGDWNVWCESCGFKFKSSELRKRWDNFMVCPDCWEIRHPQDMIRSVKEKPAPPFSRPRNDDIEDPFGTGSADNAGPSYFVDFAPANRSAL